MGCGPACQRTALGSLFSPSTFIRIPGILLRSPGLHGKHLYSLSHLAGPHLIFLRQGPLLNEKLTPLKLSQSRPGLYSTWLKLKSLCHMTSSLLNEPRPQGPLYLLVLGVKPISSYNEASSPPLPSQPRIPSNTEHKLSRLALNLRSTCLSFPSSWNDRLVLPGLATINVLNQ